MTILFFTMTTKQVQSVLNKVKILLFVSLAFATAQIFLKFEIVFLNIIHDFES